MIEYADRINSLPQYLFAAIDEEKEKLIRKGVDVIDFGVGDPDLPTPQHIIESLYKAVNKPENHRYPTYTGMLAFREAVAKWYKKTLDVDLNPENEVLTLIGSKEGIAHAPLAFLNPGDIALVPNPAYPVYNIGTILANGTPVDMPLLEENDFKPDFDAIQKDIASEASGAKLMFLNYPNNPTAATVDIKFFEEVVEFAKNYDIIVCHDNAYSEMVFDGYKAPSFLKVSGAEEIGVEFHSLSKTYNMTGWRIGFAVGNADILNGIGKVKTNVDSGAFQAIQEAGITALTGDQECVKENIKIYKERRDALIKGLTEIGLNPRIPKATFYVWSPVPKEYNSIEFSKVLLENAGIVATPGIGFGKYGEGYLRFALTQSVERIEDAVERMIKMM